MAGQHTPRPWGGACLLGNASQPVCPKGSEQGMNSRKGGGVGVLQEPDTQAPANLVCDLFGSQSTLGSKG